MRIAQLLLVLSIAFVLTGCTQYWYQEGVSIQQAQLDHNECFKNVLQGELSTSMTSAQMQAMNDCMMQKGYSLVFSVPKKADRVEPASSPYWKLHGVAGLPVERPYPYFDYNR